MVVEKARRAGHRREARREELQPQILGALGYQLRVSGDEWGVRGAGGGRNDRTSAFDIQNQSCFPGPRLRVVVSACQNQAMSSQGVVVLQMLQAILGRAYSSVC